MEFLRYPQVIPGFFNRRGCGPPRCLTTASACSWIGHPVSGLIPATSYALFRLALAAAPELQFLNLAANINSPDRSTKSTRSSFNGLSVLVGTRFQVLFHSPPGVLFTFPSRYWFAIGHKRVFSLREWSPWIHTGFHVSGITRVSSRRRPIHFAYRTITFSGRTFQTTSTMNGFCNCAWEIQAPTKTTPRHHMQQRPETYTCMGLGYLRVRSPLLAQSRLISFPPGT